MLAAKHPRSRALTAHWSNLFGGVAASDRPVDCEGFFYGEVVQDRTEGSRPLCRYRILPSPTNLARALWQYLGLIFPVAQFDSAARYQ